MTTLSHPLGRGKVAIHGERPPRPTAWLDQLMSRPDATRMVRAMPELELYLTLRTIGLGDSIDLLRMATPEQVRACIDIDCWERDQLVPERVLSWIAALIELGPERLALHIQALDHETLVTLLQGYVRVYELKEDEAPEETQGVLYHTPDTFYAVDILDESGTVQALLEALYRADLELGRRVVMGARWDIGAETEEAAYRFRAARMADMGYCDYYEALPIYQVLDPQSVKLHENSAEPLGGEPGPGLVQTEFGEVLGDDRLLLGQALAALSPDAQRQLHGRLLVLVNQVLSADRIEPTDLAGAKAVMRRTAGYLSLGIEYLIREGDEAPGGARGAVALHSVALFRLFRLGYSLTAQLGRLAALLRREGLLTVVAGEPASLVDGVLGEVVRQLAAPRPLYCQGLSGGEGTRPYQTLADVARTATAVQAVKAQADLLTIGLGLRKDNLGAMLTGKSPPPAEVRHEDLLGTMAANLLLSRPPAVVALSRQDLPALRQAALGLSPSGPQLSAAARETVLTTLRGRIAERALGQEEQQRLWSPQAERFVDRALSRLATGLSELPAGMGADLIDVVPRVRGLILD